MFPFRIVYRPLIYNDLSLNSNSDFNQTPYNIKHIKLFSQKGGLDVEIVDSDL